jgi:hypothetical protein
MANRKPQLIEHYCPFARLSVGVDLFLNKNDYSFFLDWQGERHEAGDIHTLRAKARQLIEASINLKFLPTIDVKVQARGDFQNKPVLGLEIDRLYIAKRPDGKWLSVNWYLFEKCEGNAMELFKYANHNHAISTRLASSPFDTVVITKNRDVSTSYLIPYQENLWLGLNELQMALENLRGRIEELLGTETGREIIGSAVVGLLGNGSKE